MCITCPCVLSSPCVFPFLACSGLSCDSSRTKGKGAGKNSPEKPGKGTEDQENQATEDQENQGAPEKGNEHDDDDLL
jgi:hypothetical protein